MGSGIARDSQEGAENMPLPLFAGRTAIARSCWLETKDDAIIVLDQVGNAEGCAITQVRGCQNHFT